MSSRIQFRRATAAAWTSSNPVLGAGEPGTETDTDRLKVGDGVTTWTALPYAAVDITTYLTTYSLVAQPLPPANPALGMVWIQTLI